MHRLFPLWLLLSGLSAVVFATSTAYAQAAASDLTIATFNVSMEARNYLKEGEHTDANSGPQLLMRYLAEGKHPQIHNIAEIIQRTQPDIILLNEFDFIDNPKLGIEAFIKNFLAKPHKGSQPIDYPYVFYAQVNTGLPTSFDLDNNGSHGKFAADAQGFGFYVGHYGMVLLSKYPIVNQDIRTFQRFLWSDMPDAMQPVDPETGNAFFSDLAWQNLRLSSKSHWDIPVSVDGKVLHVLASHPTPPVFDGPEDRNGRRNHDEIRFWLDYIAPDKGDYIYDDRGIFGGLSPNSHFVIMGDQNASPDRPGQVKSVISELLASPQVNNRFTPQSQAGKQNRPDSDYSQYHTAGWGARADYVIPSKAIKVKDGGVFWPTKDDALYRLVKDRETSSDHRLVWLMVSINP